MMQKTTRIKHSPSSEVEKNPKQRQNDADFDFAYSSFPLLRKDYARYLVLKL